MQTRVQKIITGILLGLIVAAAFFFITKPSAKTENSASILNAAGIGGAFTARDHNGNTITEKNLIGNYTILYFGFTYCPAICPTELQKLTKAHAKLPKATQDKVQLYFATIDPDRDTAEILKNYMGLFDDKWVGLRGNNAQTETIKRAYKIYAAKVPVGNDDYTMDHSSFVYLIAPDGTLAHLFKGTDSVEFITKTLSEIIK